MGAWMERILGRFLRHLYQDFAWAYDAVAWLVSFGRWTTWGETALPYLKRGPVLEVGCGTGRMLLRLADQVPAVGSDLSGEMLKCARRRLRRCVPPVPLCQARAQALPFPPAAFETVLSVFPSPYIYDPASWAEFRRVLRPGGRVVVVHSVRTGNVSPLRLVCGLLEGGSSGRKLPAEGFRVAWHRVSVGKDQVLLYIAEREDGTDLR